MDGILESKSSLNSLDVYSLKFNHCRNIYPIRLIKPCEKYKYDEQEELSHVLNDINDNGLIIDCAVFDNPKRSNMRCAKCASAKFACEYCVNCAISFVDHDKKSLVMIRKKYETMERKLRKEIEELQQTQNDQEENDYLTHLQEMLVEINRERETELKKKGRKKLTWPASTMTGNLRTLEKIKEISEAIVSNPDIVKTDPEYCEGIKGKSLFLEQPFFNLLKDMPCEYMHLVCLEVVKRMFELNFKVGEVRERKTKRKLSSPTLYNEKVKLVKFLRESSRRARNLDFSVMKASEFRNGLIFLFPIILDCIEDEFKNDKKIWLHLVFMIRACIIPNDEFRKIDDDQVESAGKKFYNLYEKLYGQINCTYSIHVASSHLLQMRGNRPLTFKSAFKFEGFFAEMRNLFHPGSVSPLKQIIQNCFVKRMLEFHTCEKSLFFAPQKQRQGKEDNSLIYTHDEDGNISIYSIIEVIDNDSFNCNKHGKFPAKFSLTPEYDWSDVGVFQIGPLSEECVVVHKQNVSGKVMKVNGYLITCPTNVLLEQ